MNKPRKLTVTLPCALGDKAYYYIDDLEMGEAYINEFAVQGIGLKADGWYIFNGDDWDKIGTQFAFLTRAQAEAGLKKALGDKTDGIFE